MTIISENDILWDREVGLRFMTASAEEKRLLVFKLVDVNCRLLMVMNDWNGKK